MAKDVKTRNEELQQLQVTTRAICMNRHCGVKGKVPTALAMVMIHTLPKQLITGKMVPRVQGKDKPPFKRLTTSDCNCMKVWQLGWWRECQDAQRPMHLNVKKGRQAGQIKDRWIKTSPQTLGGRAIT